jgi:uncharacterized protein YbjT (DUF2867 family)
MRVVIAGGHGQIARRLGRLLAARGDAVAGLIRKPDQADDLRDDGVEPVVLDLEAASVEDVAGVLAGADAVVFSAGAGPGSGAARKETVDRGAAVLLADAAERAGVRRYVIVSSIGATADPPPGMEPVFAAYLRAKHAADEDLRRRPLDWTVLRPGHLTNDAGTGRIQLAPRVGRGAVPRDDVAETLLALLDTPASAGHTLELVGGDTPVADAVEAAVSGS